MTRRRRAARRRARILLASCLTLLCLMALVCVSVFVFQRDALQAVAITAPPSPTVEPASLAKADAAWQEGKLDEAAAELARYIQQNPNDVRAMAKRTRALAYLYRGAEAVQLGEQARKLAPRDAEVLASLALAYNWNEDPATAVDIGLEAVAADDKLVLAYVTLAEAQIELRIVNQALANVKYALQLDPNDAEAHRVLGWIYENQGAYAAAIQNYERSIQLNPKFHITYVNLGAAQRAMGQREQALVTLEKARALQPRDAHTIFQIGLTYYLQQDFDSAERHFKEATLYDGNFAGAFAYLGYTYYNLQKWPEAVAALQRAVALRPNNARYQAYLGWSYYYTRQMNEAKAAFEKALALDAKLDLAVQGLQSTNAVLEGRKPPP